MRIHFFQFGRLPHTGITRPPGIAVTCEDTIRPETYMHREMARKPWQHQHALTQVTRDDLEND